MSLLDHVEEGAGFTLETAIAASGGLGDFGCGVFR